MLIALVVVALGATDAITYTSLRSYLFQQVDSTLANISAVSSVPGVGGVVENALLNPEHNELGLPNGTFAAIYDTDAGAVLAQQLPATAGWTGGVPVVPVKYLEGALPNLGQSVTMSTQGTSDTRFRLFAESVQVAAIRGQGSFSGLFVVAIPLNGVEGTAHRLLILELLVSCAVLIALAAAAWLTVRIGLRPLEKMTETAREIAAGDLSRRVEVTDSTEVGQLGSALNVMLGRIETAFREREASEARLRRFVADASHELRTPLTSIRGYAELFQHGLADRPADLDTAMRRIDSESIRMAGLVDDLLLLARLDQGRPLEREPIDLTTITGDAAQDARAVDPTRTVTCKAPPSCPIVGDEGRLRQLLGNLVSNALAYTPAGSPLEIITVLEPPEGSAPSRAKVSVIDHGPGITADAAAHVFERFWRSDPARVRAHGGAGLGLSMVAAIAEAHGGRVSLTETPAGGATFSVELPTGPIPEQPSHWGADTTGAEPTEESPAPTGTDWASDSSARQDATSSADQQLSF